VHQLVKKKTLIISRRCTVCVCEKKVQASLCVHRSFTQAWSWKLLLKTCRIHITKNLSTADRENQLFGISRNDLYKLYRLRSVQNYFWRHASKNQWTLTNLTWRKPRVKGQRRCSWGWATSGAFHTSSLDRQLCVCASLLILHRGQTMFQWNQEVGSLVFKAWQGMLVL
jgi:hypothetical protein